MRYKLLIATVALSLAACNGSDTPAGQASQARTAPPVEQTPERAPTARTESAAPASQDSAPSAGASTSPPAAGSEAAPPAAAAADAPASSAAARVAEADPPAASIERRFQEGRHYTRLTPQQPTVETEGDRVEVAEVFQYSCPACFNFEPFLTQWDESKADYVNFVRVPAPWNALSELHARAYYTAETLGVVDQIHSPFFREIHVNGNYLESEEALAEFFSQFGVDEETFSSTFNSFAVHTKLQRARDLVTRYRVSGTPGIVVAGKYVTGGQQAQSYENWFEIINELAAVEHAAN